MKKANEINNKSYKKITLTAKKNRMIECLEGLSKKYTKHKKYDMTYILKKSNPAHRNILKLNINSILVKKYFFLNK